MSIRSEVIYSTVIICLSLVIISLIDILYRAKRDFKIQSVRTINLYLDKKFLYKLLLMIREFDKMNDLRILLEEILDYFCLDFVALYIKDQDKIFHVKSMAVNKLYTEKDMKLLFSHSNSINEESGYKMIKIENKRQFIVFKNMEICMLIILEEKHKLSIEEKETLVNEVMLFLNLGINIMRFAKA